MNIALIILNGDPSRGGAERYTVDLAGALAAGGHAVSLLSGTTSCGESMKKTTDTGYESVRLPMSGLTRSRRYLEFARNVRSWLQEHPQDVVHAMLPMAGCDVYHPHAGFAVAALRGKYIQAFFNPRRRLYARVERRLLDAPSPPVVICLSDMVRREFAHTNPLFPPEHLRVVFNAVDLSRFTPPPHRENRKPVEALLVAHSYKLKGVRTAIIALEHAPDVTLTVVGRDSPAPYLRLARRLGVAGRVSFPGPQSDLSLFYQKADFLVLPTRRDSCSLVVLEALASGLPVISTRHNGACEIMRNGEHGFVLDEADDVHAFAHSMNRLVDPQTRERMQSACMNLRERLAYRRHLDEVLDVYQHSASLRSQNTTQS